jgi:hypothetical protein
MKSYPQCRRLLAYRRRALHRPTVNADRCHDVSRRHHRERARWESRTGAPSTLAPQLRSRRQRLVATPSTRAGNDYVASRARVALSPRIPGFVLLLVPVLSRRIRVSAHPPSQPLWMRGVVSRYRMFIRPHSQRVRDWDNLTSPPKAVHSVLTQNESNVGAERAQPAKTIDAVSIVYHMRQEK